MSDATYATNIVTGNLGAAKDVTAPATEGRDEFTESFTLRKAAVDAMAGDATAETLGFDIPYDGIVLRAFIKAQAAVTGHADNHATVTLNKRDAAAGGSATVATYTTDTDVTGQGSLAQWVRKAFALTNANVVVAKGGSINFAIAKGGTGVVMQIFEVTVHILRTGARS